MINWKFEFRDETGKVIMMQDEKTGERIPATLLPAAQKALLYPPKELVLTPQMKLKRYQIASRMQVFKEATSLDKDELAIVEGAMAEVYVPIVAGQASDILNERENPWEAVNAGQ